MLIILSMNGIIINKSAPSLLEFGVIIMRYSFRVNDRSLPFYVDSIGYDWHQEDINRPHGYPYVHWLQSLSGAGEITVGDQTFLLEEGQGILIHQGIPHAYHSISGDWQTEFFTFGGALISETTAMLGFHDYLLVKEQDQQIFEFIKNHHLEIEDPNPLQFYRSSELVYQFLLLLKRHLITNPRNQPIYQNVIEPIIQMIHDKYGEDLDNSDFAEFSNYSEQYILEVFRKFAGTSPHQYLLQYRIQKAKELLLNNSKYSVEEVGKMVGFNTNSHFISVFKRFEHITPGKFRHFYF